MPYAFLSHNSALEALRSLDRELPTWPKEPRLLPVFGECVRNQRMFKELCPNDQLNEWGVRERPVDLLVPHESMRSRGKSARFHVWKGPLPLDSMLRLSESVLVSKPAFAVIQLAGYHTKNDLIADEFLRQLFDDRETLAQLGISEGPIYDNPFRWEQVVRLVGLLKVVCELLGTYRLGTGGMPTRYCLPPLVTREEIEALVASIPYLYGASRVRRALELGFEGSASPMETALALMLTLPVEMGGFGLPRPSLNVSIDENGLELVHQWNREAIPDLYWKSKGLILEYESNEFHTKAGTAKLARDATRANGLSAQGYTVLRAMAENVLSLGELELLARQVAELLGVSFPEVDAIGRWRRERLHALLVS